MAHSTNGDQKKMAIEKPLDRWRFKPLRTLLITNWDGSALHESAPVLRDFPLPILLSHEPSCLRVEQICEEKNS